MRSEELFTRRLETQLRVVDARLDIMQAQAEAHEDQHELAEVFSLRAATEEVRWSLAGLKDLAPADRARVRRGAEVALRGLDGAIERAHGQYAGRGGAGPRHLHAHLDEAEAQLRLWQARRAVEAAERELELYDVALEVQESSALAHARDAAVRRERHLRLAQEAHAETARQLGEALDAAARRHAVQQQQ
jgi:hypothetical protein